MPLPVFLNGTTIVPSSESQQNIINIAFSMRIGMILPVAKSRLYYIAKISKILQNLCHLIAVRSLTDRRSLTSAYSSGVAIEVAHKVQYAPPVKKIHHIFGM